MALQDVVARHVRGEAVGVWSLCSAHPAVIESAMREAGAAGAALLVEATSNQVNQFGGYTGMRPGAFVGFVPGSAARAGRNAMRCCCWRPPDCACAKDCA